MKKTLALLVALIAPVACNKKKEGGGGGGTTAAKTYNIPQASKDRFTQECSTCHGSDGKGNGPAAASLNPKPRNYTDAKWQDSVTDDHIKKVIIEGGAANGLSPIMPAHDDLKDKPDVVEGLVGIIRGFRGK